MSYVFISAGQVSYSVEHSSGWKERYVLHCCCWFLLPNTLVDLHSCYIKALWFKLKCFVYFVPFLFNQRAVHTAQKQELVGKAIQSGTTTPTVRVAYASITEAGVATTTDSTLRTPVNESALGWRVGLFSKLHYYSSCPDHKELL